MRVMFFSSGHEEIQPGVHPVQAIKFIGSRPLDLDALKDQYPVYALHHLMGQAAAFATQDMAIDARGEQPKAIYRRDMEGTQ